MFSSTNCPICGEELFFVDDGANKSYVYHELETHIYQANIYNYPKIHNCITVFDKKRTVIFNFYQIKSGTEYCCCFNYCSGISKQKINLETDPDKNIFESNNYNDYLQYYSSIIESMLEPEKLVLLL